jgi:hypothetical protein
MLAYLRASADFSAATILLQAAEVLPLLNRHHCGV